MTDQLSAAAPAAPAPAGSRAARRDAGSTSTTGCAARPRRAGAAQTDDSATCRRSGRFYDARRPIPDPSGRCSAEMSAATLPADRSVSWTRGGFVYYTSTVAGKEYEQFYRDVTGTISAAERAAGRERARRGLRLPRARASASRARTGGCWPTRSTSTATRSTSCASATSATGAGPARRAAAHLLRRRLVGRLARPSSTPSTTRPTGRTRCGGTPRHRRPRPTPGLEEPDDRFELDRRGPRSGAYVVIRSGRKDSSEVWLVPTRPTRRSRRAVVEPRARASEYTVAHAPRHRTATGCSIVTDDGAPEFRLMRAPVATPGREHWAELVGRGPRRTAGGRRRLRASTSC